MLSRLLRVLLSAGYFLSSYAAAGEHEYVFRYEKDLQSRGRIDFAGVFAENYSEIRWDKNGDGHIDQWLIRLGSLEVAELFEQGELKSLNIRKRSTDSNLVISYILSAKDRLRLADAKVIPFRHQNKEDDDSFFTSGNSSKNTLSNLNNACRPVSSALDERKLEQIRQIAAKGELEGKINKMIQPQCLAQLTQPQKESFHSAMKTIFEINPEGSVEQNKIALCLAQNKFTQELVPKYIETVLTAPIGDESSKVPPLQIQCSPNPAGKCGQSSFEEKSCQIHIPIPNPPCQTDFKDFYLTNLLHETIHRVSSEVPEQAVQEIVSTCLSKKPPEKTKGETSLKGADSKTAEDSHKPNPNQISQLPFKAGEGVTQDFQAGIGVKNVILVPGPASTTNSSNKTAGEKTAIVPKELAAGAAAPGGSQGGTGSFASLDSGFRPVGSGSSTETNFQAYTQSRARTSSVLALADGIVRNAVVQPARAETVTASPTAASVASSASSQSNSSSSKSTKSTWLEDSRPATSVSASVPNMEMNRDNNFKVSGVKQGESDSREAARANVPSSPSSAPTRAPSSSTGSSKVQLGSSGSSNSIKTQGEPQSPQDRRNELESQLRQLSNGPLWDYVMKNQAEIEKYKIHILDSKNKIWGYRNPTQAAVRFREQNHRLIREDR